ncbi:hypothetical protein ACMGDH_16965 [Sphingomonas sp. DT-207]|uniref:hypothetical protein n=1 Tax=Sphingomonas sp. DT-207 TaxID=3396167 RepID=UPI003F195814
MDGEAGAGPITAHVEASPADIFKNLSWGAMGIIEANNGRIGIAVDLTYMKLKSEREGRIDEIGGDQGAYTGMFLVRVDPHAEAYVGARLNDLGLEISGRGPLGGSVTVSPSKSWVDPIVGMRVNLPISGSADLTVLTDVGGFGIGSDVSFQAWPSFGFRLSKSAKAMVGYRLLYTDYEDGEGLDRFAYSVLTHGPTLGVQFRF